jgi:DNA polymerase (family 10)
MPVNNEEIAELFTKTANLLEIQGANRFRVRAYRNAAITIQNAPESLADLIAQGADLAELPGIGRDLASKIREIVKTGKFSLLLEIEKQIPEDLADLMKISGLGAKRIKKLYDKLKIISLKDLEAAAEAHKIQKLAGFGVKTEQTIVDGIKRVKVSGKRLKISTAETIINPIVKYLKQSGMLVAIDVAGSYRRCKETVGDVDILVTCKKGADIVDYFIKYDQVRKVLAKGDTKASIQLKSGFQVDLRDVPEESYGAALVYFTGSKEHNIAIRKCAIENKLKISEYGVFRGDKMIAGKTEAEVYKAIDLPFIPPELREDRGEIAAARKNKLPDLIDLKDIKGDLHTHTNLTDGHNTLEEMAKAAQAKGYSYLGISDHTKHVTVAHGLDVNAVARQIKQIDKLNEKFKNFTILKAIEVDILADGSLDLPDEILSQLDYTICSIHYKFNLPKAQQTERILKAMNNPYFTIFGHPTGRLLLERDPYEFDMEQVMRAAKHKGLILELNAHPFRLDLNDVHCKMAKDLGIKISIATDAHSVQDLELMRFGIGQARRGWLEKEDVINTLPLSQLQKIIK